MTLSSFIVKSISKVITKIKTAVNDKIQHSIDKGMVTGTTTVSNGGFYDSDDSDEIRYGAIRMGSYLNLPRQQAKKKYSIYDSIDDALERIALQIPDALSKNPTENPSVIIGRVIDSQVAPPYNSLIKKILTTYPNRITSHSPNAIANAIREKYKKGAE